MTDAAMDADTLADMVLPLSSPYSPDQVVEAAQTIRELVRRLNHVTWSQSAFQYPSQLDSAVGALRAAIYGLHQTFTQVAARLDAFAADPRVEHDGRLDPGVEGASAAEHIRHAAATIRAVTGPLDEATAITSHFSYNTSTGRPRPTDLSTVRVIGTLHEGPNITPPTPPRPPTGRGR